ncbi:MAG: hypothetical protein NC548_48370 [Lachnospiraceae bacterium]|nr:hypothetical protein [Lachnospiraceae bacterium]
MFWRNVDKELEKLGFMKVEDNDHIVQYERPEDMYGYTQCLSICHKQSGRHIIQTYQKDVNKDGFNNCDGLTYTEMKLALMKMRQKGWKS